MRRVVITGLGLVTPLGWGVEHSWSRLLAGQSGAGRITAFDPTDFACQIACEVPRIDGRGGGSADYPGSYDPEQTMSLRDRRRVDDFIPMPLPPPLRRCVTVAGTPRLRKIAAGRA